MKNKQYRVKFFLENELIYEVTVKHNIVYKALLFAEAALINKKINATYDQVDISEIYDDEESK